MDRLPRKMTGLLVIDVQEKLFPHLENGCSALKNMETILLGFQILNLPIIVSEQYPKGLGGTVAPLVRHFTAPPFSKTSFSCLGNEVLREAILSKEVTHWVLVGIEAHVCVLQTAKDLLAAGKNVAVLNDAIASRSIFDFSTAIGELRDSRVRISSTETVLFELVGDSKAPEFKAISELIKCAGGDTSRCCCA